MGLTCAALLVALADPASAGQTLTLAPGQDCPTIHVRTTFDPLVTVIAEGSTIHGLQADGASGLNWLGGTIVAPVDQDADAADGYAVWIYQSHRISIMDATLTVAKYGIVTGLSTDIGISNNTFVRYRVDGIDVTDVQRLMIAGNTFSDQSPHPTTCMVSDPKSVVIKPATVTYGLSHGACTALGGSWVDGDHGGAVQMHDNVTDAVLSYNVIRGPTRGLDQMNFPADRPLSRIAIDYNDVMTDAVHQIALGDNALDSVIRWNTVRHADGSTRAAIIQPGAAYVCGNTVPDRTSTAGPAC